MRALLLAALFFCTQIWAQNVLPVPELTARVIDQTATLTSDEVLALTNQLKKIEDERGAQVVVLMIASTQPEDIFSYSNRVANAWKIGRKDIGDGVLMVVAKQDRKLRIEIAKSLEGAIPDVLAGQIITEHISPLFKQGQYASGLQAGVGQIALRIAENSNESSTTKPSNQPSDDSTNYNALLILLLIVVLMIIAPYVPVLNLIFSLFGRASAYNSGFSGSGSFSSGGFSSGGFSSGGGGNFGGGGASGDW